MDQSQIAGLLGQALPVQYQGGLEDVRRRKMIAEALQMQSMQAQPTEVITGHAVPQSKMGNIARLLTGGLGAYQSSQAQGQINQVQNQAANDERAGAQQLSQMFRQNPQQAIAAGRGSPFPSHKAMAQGWEKMVQEQQLAGGKIIGERGDTAGALKALTQGLPAEGYTPNVPKQPETGFKTGPTGEPVPYVTNFDKFDIPTMRLGSEGTKVSTTVGNHFPAEEKKAELGIFKDEFKARQEKAQLALDNLDANRLAFEGLNAGAKVGGLGDWKQGTRKVAQAFGFDIDTTGPTEQVKMALGQNLLNNLRKFAPVSDSDAQKANLLLGSIDTDPQALEKLMSWYNGAALKALQDFRRYADATIADSGQGESIRSIARRGLVGFDMRAPVGNIHQQMETLREFQQRGGDPSIYQMGAEQFPANATFNVDENGAPMPAVPASAAGSLSGEKLKRYNQLKKELGLP